MKRQCWPKRMRSCGRRLAMQPDGWQQVRRVLVVRPDNIGDVVMLGPALRTLRLELRVPAAIQARADGKLGAAGVDPCAPFIVLAPGASCPARRYNLQRFAAVARALSSETGLPLVVVGSAREAELVAPILDVAPP